MAKETVGIFLPDVPGVAAGAGAGRVRLPVADIPSVSTIHGVLLIRSRYRVRGGPVHDLGLGLVAPRCLDRSKISLGLWEYFREFAGLLVVIDAVL